MGPNFETKLIGGGAEESEGDALFIPRQYGLEPEIVEELQREVNFKQDRKSYQAIKKIIEEYKPDIVHTHASKAGAVGRLAASRAKVPVIVHTFHGHVFHSYFGKVKTAIYIAVERYLAKKSTAIIAISKKQKQELTEVHRIAPSKKVEVVNLGFDLDRFQENKIDKKKQFEQAYRIEDNAICIGVIGRLTAVKNHHLFFEVIKKVFSKTTKKLHVFIIGDGELMSELNAISNQILYDFPNQKITFTSWIKDVSVPLSRLDIVCLTSFNEGTPVSLIEAQAANVAVVSTNVGGVEDILSHNNSGFVVNGLDSEAFCEKLMILIHDSKKLAEMKAYGWGFVREKFHYKTLCLNIEQLYLRLLK
ncbi:MAG: glycosyltransferase [Crocinitomicaceae bacterium]